MELYQLHWYDPISITFFLSSYPTPIKASIANSISLISIALSFSGLEYGEMKVSYITLLHLEYLCKDNLKNYSCKWDIHNGILCFRIHRWPWRCCRTGSRQSCWRFELQWYTSWTLRTFVFTPGLSGVGFFLKIDETITKDGLCFWFSWICPLPYREETPGFLWEAEEERHSPGFKPSELQSHIQNAWGKRCKGYLWRARDHTDRLLPYCSR